MVAVLEALLASLLALRVPRLLYSIAAFRGVQGKSADMVASKLPKISAVVAAKEEPVWLIEGLIHNLASLEYRPAEVVVVWDWPARGYERLRERLSRLSRRLGIPVKVVAKAWRGRGKAGALNAALMVVEGDAILVVDPDDRVCRTDALRVAASLLKRGYDAVQLGVVGFAPLHASQRPAAAAVTSGYRVTHIGRHAVGLPTLLVGSGMVVSRRLAERLLFDEEAIVEDVDFTVRALAAGARVTLVPDALCMSGAPGYSAFRTQQRRWARGAAWILRRRFRWALRLGVARGLELVYTLSLYALDPLTLIIASILALVAPLSPLLPLYAALLITEAMVAGVHARAALIPSKLRASAAAGAFATILQPLLLAEWVLGLVKPGVYRVTPRRPRGEGPGLSEKLFAALMVIPAARVLAAHSSLAGVLASFPFISAPLALAYVALRHARLERGA